jgi:dCTP deaminase
MISGKEIERLVAADVITISPVRGSCFGPNSYDVHVGKHLAEVRPNAEYRDCPCIDLHLPGAIQPIELTPEGHWIIQPGHLYLAAIEETIGSNTHAPMIEGRSSVARHGLAVHITAGFGDVGWFGQFVLELANMAPHPILLRPGDRIAQVSFERVDGEIEPYNSDYQYQIGIRPSKGIN